MKKDRYLIPAVLSGVIIGHNLKPVNYFVAFCSCCRHDLIFAVSSRILVCPNCGTIQAVGCVYEVNTRHVKTSEASIESPAFEFLQRLQERA